MDERNRPIGNTVFIDAIQNQLLLECSLSAFNLSAFNLSAFPGYLSGSAASRLIDHILKFS
jgi:hypothetical protein